MSAVARELGRLLPGRVQIDVPLKEVSRWRIGGNADLIVSPRTQEELALIRNWIHQQQLPSVVIGATSNLLFSDDGLRAIAIHIGPEFSALSIQGQTIYASPGVWVPGLARQAMLAGLTGIEHTCGIPGTLGGLVCMNGGSQRRGIGENVISVSSVDQAGLVIKRSVEECGFEYRSSIFQGNGEVISYIELKLQSEHDKSVRRREMLAILRDRRTKFPQKVPNCGSVFVSNPAMYAEYGPPGKVIEAAGFKGYRIGNAFISPMHANFIINDMNNGGASANNVLQLIKIVQTRVAQETGYLMAVEVRQVLASGKIVCL